MISVVGGNFQAACAAGLDQFEGCYRTILWEGVPVHLKPNQKEKLGSIKLTHASLYQDLNHNDMSVLGIEWFVGDFWLGEMVGKLLITDKSVVQVGPSKFETRFQGELLLKGNLEKLTQWSVIERLANNDVSFKYGEEHDQGGAFGSDAVLRPVPCP
jgi:hypothetical protein